MLFIPTLPASEIRFAEYRVTLNGQPAPVWIARASRYPINREWVGRTRQLEQTELCGFVPFVMDEPVEVRVEPLFKAIETVELRPRAFGVQPSIEDGVICFTMDKPQYLTLQLNGQFEALHFFPSAPKDYGVQPGENVRWFGPGIHEIGPTVLHSNETVYIDDNAVVYGSFFAKDAENIRILGRGVLDASLIARPEKSYLFEDAGDGMLCFTRCRNVTVDGLILRDPNLWTMVTNLCEDVHFSDIKGIGWRPNSDGIDICNSKHCSLRNAFLRVYDDVLVIKGLKQHDEHCDFDARADTDDITIEDCVAWCDWGRGIELGLETAGNEMKNITYRRCHIIKSSFESIDVACTFRADVHDLLIEDCSVENDELNLRPVFQTSDDQKYIVDPTDDYTPTALAVRVFEWSGDPTGERGCANRITFRNSDLWSKLQPKCQLLAYSAEHRIADTVFEDIRWNGNRLDTREKLNLDESDFVDRTVVR